MARARKHPYIWTTWIARLLVGENHCEWAGWFRAHCLDCAKSPRDFDQSRWMLDHTALVNEAKERGKIRILGLYRKPEFIFSPGSHSHPRREVGPDCGQGQRPGDHRHQDREIQSPPQRPGSDLPVRGPEGARAVQGNGMPGPRHLPRRERADSSQRGGREVFGAAGERSSDGCRQRPGRGRCPAARSAVSATSPQRTARNGWKRGKAMRE